MEHERLVGMLEVYGGTVFMLVSLFERTARHLGVVLCVLCRQEFANGKEKASGHMCEFEKWERMVLFLGRQRWMDGWMVRYPRWHAGRAWVYELWWDHGLWHGVLRFCFLSLFSVGVSTGRESGRKVVRISERTTKVQKRDVYTFGNVLFKGRQCNAVPRENTKRRREACKF